MSQAEGNSNRPLENIQALNYLRRKSFHISILGYLGYVPGVYFFQQVLIETTWWETCNKKVEKKTDTSGKTNM